MTRINSNINSLVAQRVLQQQNATLNRSLERLSTGLAINRGSDNPAGLIASESLRAQKQSISSALSSAERAGQILNVAEGGLGEVQTLLTELQGLVSETANEAGLSTEEKEANQLQVDQILQTIDRIASVTNFGGTKLLNGGMEFQVSAVHDNVADYKIYSAKVPYGGSVDVNVSVMLSAQHAGLYLSTDGDLDLTANSSTFVIEVGGKLGTRQFAFTSGTTADEMADAINQFKSITGVSAVASGGLVLKSTEYGSDQFVSFNIIDDGGQTGNVYQLSGTREDEADTGSATDFADVSSPIRDEGQDVAAMVNGVMARGRGTTVSVSTDALDASIELDSTGATTRGQITALSVTGGGARFQVGDAVNIENQIQFGMPSVSTNKLGSNSLGFLSSLKSGGDNSLLSDNLGDAQKIVDASVTQIAQLRGRLGSWQTTTIQSTINSLSVALENTTAAESAIRDTDFAQETAQMTRAQVLSAAASNALALANAQPQSVLRLLG